MKKYRYQLRYIGAPLGDGEYEIVKTAFSLKGLQNLFKMQDQPKYYGSNSIVVDTTINDPMNPQQLAERP